MSHDLLIQRDLCARDGLCVKACPSGTIRLDDQQIPEEVPGAGCVLCGHCVAICPKDAISIHGLSAHTMEPIRKDLPAPTQLDALLRSRRSIRNYGKKAIDRPTLEALLDVARYAPTARNSQLLHWIVIPTPSQVQSITAEMVRWAEETDPQLAARAHAYAEDGRDIFLRGAPTVLVVTAPSSYLWGKEDCATALAYLELAAESRGFGACWAGYLTAAANLDLGVAKLLGVPENHVVCGGLMLGPSKEHYRRIPPRNPLSITWLSS